MLNELTGGWALVTGASAGIGLEFCRQLAARGVNLLMVARRRDLMEAEGKRLADAYGVRVLVFSVDLAADGAARSVRTAAEREGARIRLLVNNAGAGRWGSFEKVEAADYERIVALNCAAMVALCREFHSDLVATAPSTVINVSSPAAFQPVPYMAVYAATKAFVQSFSLALFEEWRAQGIGVKALIPGPTQTDFDRKAGAYESALKGRDQPARVVEAALAGLEGADPIIAVAKGIAKQRIFGALLPPRMLVREVAKMFRPPP
jgi:short-subunit dehydrogenase